MEYVIGIIILLLVIIMAGYVIKKKYYKEVDRLESWKLDIMDRPILDEMSKVKQLNMTGQTEELFERWRSEWDDIVTVKLPGLEEMLFDAEEYIDRYRFRKAKDVQKQIEKNLQDTEEKIKNILNELNELVGSEEKNRVEIDELKELYREAKKQLLAHRHSFGSSEQHIEEQLNETVHQFQDYEEKTENGNYLEARETVLLLKERLQNVKNEMDVIPELLIECQSVIPSQLSDVRDGFREMSEQGYYLEHIQLEKEMAELDGKLKGCLDHLEKADIQKANEEIQEIKGRVEDLFDLLEKEVHAKHFILQNEDATNTLLLSVREANEQLSSEVDQVQQSYHLTENDFEKQKHLERELSSLYKRFEIFNETLKENQTAQSAVSEELMAIKEQLNAIYEEQQVFFKRLQDLRKDEFDAREKIKELSRKIGDAMRLISKSNIPGLPEEYEILFQDSKDSIENVKKQLEEKPLNISAVNQHLEIAVLTVEKLISSTYELMENVTLAEKVIQYGNRYRSQYPSLSKALAEAEKSFRCFEYEKALEKAATSLQEVEPGAIKKIEEFVSKEEILK